MYAYAFLVPLFSQHYQKIKKEAGIVSAPTPTTPTKAKAAKTKGGSTPSTPSKRKRGEGKQTPKTPEKKRKMKKPVFDDHDEDDYNDGDNSGLRMSDATMEGEMAQEGVFPSSEGEAEKYE